MIDEFPLDKDWTINKDGKMIFKRSWWMQKPEYCGIRIHQGRGHFQMCRLMRDHNGEHVWGDY